MTNRKHVAWIAGVACAVALVCGPLAVWLQARPWQASPAMRPDAIYLVAGARHQDLRVDAARSWLRRTAQHPRVLVGNDRTRGGWSTTAQRNLSFGEWGAVKVRRLLDLTPGGADVSVDIVPGEFDGTDGEMAALAVFLARNPGIRHVTVVTSAFHVRRAVSRLRRHVGETCLVSAIPASAGLEDYTPWAVLGEAAKLGRDSVGLAHAPFISRAAWFDERDAWIAAVFLLLIYAWILYPLLLRMAAGRKAVAPRPGNAVPSPMAPHVTVIVAAHNEAEHIGRRIGNLLGQQWPGERLDIWIGSDGSTDRTAEAALGAARGDPRVRVVTYRDRRGKTAVLRDLVAASAEALPATAAADDILVFTDANTEFETGAVKALVEALSVPGVGGACGRLVFTCGREGLNTAASPSASRGGEETGYWQWENLLKQREARLDSCLGANGAIYAVRRSLFWSTIPSNTIVDDFVIGMKVREQGGRMAYAEGAVAVEPLPPSDRDEWRRRVRIGAGAFQALVLCRRCLLPRFGWFAWMFWSHKVLRWFTPHLLLVLLAAAWWLLVSRVSGGCGWSLGLLIGGLVQAVLLVAPIVWRVGEGRGVVRRTLRLIGYFFFIQAAMLAGFLRFCRGGLSGAWERTRR